MWGFCTLQGMEYALKRLYKGDIFQAPCWEFSRIFLESTQNQSFKAGPEAEKRVCAERKILSMPGPLESDWNPIIDQLQRTCKRGLYSKWELRDGIFWTHYSMIFHRFFELIISMAWISGMLTNLRTGSCNFITRAELNAPFGFLTALSSIPVSSGFSPIPIGWWGFYGSCEDSQYARSLCGIAVSCSSSILAVFFLKAAAKGSFKKSAAIKDCH